MPQVDRRLSKCKIEKTAHLDCEWEINKDLMKSIKNIFFGVVALAALVVHSGTTSSEAGQTLTYLSCAEIKEEQITEVERFQGFVDPEIFATMDWRVAAIGLTI